MLTLSRNRQIGTCSVFRDFFLADGKPQYTNLFYALPDAPRWAINEEGDPSFDFLWYRTLATDATRNGGIVTMMVDLSVTGDQRNALLQTIPAEFALGPTEVELRSIPFKSGTVDLAFAGESTDGEFTNQIAGSGPARFAGAERAAFSLDLSADGASLLWQAIDRRLALFRVRYDLVFEHRLTGVRMRVWCDARKSYPAAEQWLKSGGSDPRQLRVGLMEQRLAGVELSSEDPLRSEQASALQECGQEILDRALASTLFSFDDASARRGDDSGSDSRGAGRALRLQPYSELMERSLNLSFNESYPLEQHAVLEAVLHLDLSPDQLARRIDRLDVTSGFFDILECSDCLHCRIHEVARLRGKGPHRLQRCRAVGSGPEN